jgi:SecA Wing and Scaffold domain
MDYLREGIGLRAMAQRDPLVEYQREGGDMFNVMMEAFMEEVVGYVFHLDVEVQETPLVGVVADSDGHPITIGAGRTDAGSPNGQDRAGIHLVESGPDPDGPGVAVHPVDDDESEPAIPVEEAIAAQLLGSGRGRLCAESWQDAEQGRQPVRECGSQRAVSVRLREEVQDVSRTARRRLVLPLLDYHSARSLRSLFMPPRT